MHTKLGNPLTSFGYDGFANSCRRLKLCTRVQPDWIRLDGDKFIFFSGDRVGVIKRNCERYDLVKMNVRNHNHGLLHAWNKQLD